MRLHRINVRPAAAAPLHGKNHSNNTPKMMRKEKKKSATVYVVALVFLTCDVVQMVNCFRLKKSERREERAAVNAAKGASVRQGSVVFGRVFDKGLGRPGKTNSHAFVEDKSNYQSDFAGWSKGQTHDSSSREAAWKRLASSLQCSGAHMLFRAVGPGASHFSLEQGGAPPMPLSQVPSTCGYSMHRDPLALVMMVPYEGCNILQEGGNYVLPLRWHGIPVSLWCPKPAGVSQTPENLGSVIGLEPTKAATTTTKPDTSTFPQYPYPFHFYSHYPFFPPPFPVTTAAPTTTTAEPTTTSTTTTTVGAAAAGPAQMYPFPFNSPQYAPFNWPFPGPFAAAAEPTITQTNAMTAPWLLQFPQYIPFYHQRLPSHLFPHYRQYPVQMPEMIRWPQPDPMQYQHFHDHIPA